MSGSKVFVFGSFTEDETKSLLLQSSNVSEKTLERSELQIGTVSIRIGKDLNDHTTQSKGQLNSSKGTSGLKPSKSPKQGVLPSKGRAYAKDPASSSLPKENGNTSVASITNGMKELRTEGGSLSAINIPQNDSSSLAHASTFDVLNEGKSRETEQDVNIVDSLVPLPKDETKNSSDVVVSSAISFLPRGIVNSGNLCFLNATLQALLSCSPFVHLLLKLKHENIPKVDYPTLHAFVEFISEFEITNNTSENEKKDTASMDVGRPFSPVMFEVVLRNFTPDVQNGISGRPRQEDAQEFLTFIMDKMHNELLKFGGQSSLSTFVDDDEWETVGPKNKSAVTRTQSLVPSELTDIFGGQYHSVVKSRGNKASATVDPFNLLQLDIHPEAVHKIEDALRLYSAPEALDDYKTYGGGKEDIVAASKSVQIKTLPKVLILHLMRFSYGSQGIAKLYKPVSFPLNLVLPRELLVSSSPKGRKYELFATVTHHGRDPSRGHYTTDARYSNGQWLRFDDASVSAIGTNKVLHDQAYLLFYKQI